ncbi:hypothetical protein BU24DRAFT_422012 [Aaosphaeria arxii CBS 175.79]|uniref:NTF2 domain-containing protein n=1 Tax=Aaosphaeria arxii CBS 175.79 TaxID=1450172 RepID=A0A6A5XR95_9PLEO|nr:uncharacterized protein BU24DRAFT_422012 [Aaosphaeria arxii CBS 175.79]KAF2015702.1 hypothetical protein BU24DRAFT_422012 [Aaosphaeria arxii CBS 175.79]
MNDESQLTAAEKAEYTADITACNAAEAFTDAYYFALQKDRQNIPSFYCPPLANGDQSVPFIAWNGEVFSDVVALQTRIQTLPHTWFDVESLDCDVLNPKFIPASEVKNGSGNDDEDLHRRMSITVAVAGAIRMEEQFKGPLREFSETFVLVPNPEKLTTKAVHFDKGWQKEWLIQSQNFRFTEWSANELVDPAEASVPMETDKTRVNGGKNTFRGTNKGIAGQFAAAGLLKGKGKA